VKIGVVLHDFGVPGRLNQLFNDEFPLENLSIGMIRDPKVASGD
jgi:hypothetical protein